MKTKKTKQKNNFFLKSESYYKLFFVTMFAIAMAFLESAVVVYLRKLYYPLGFKFPIAYSNDILLFNVEWFREFFTIVMLICIGILAGKKLYERFAYFIYAFAIWDIFYYLWLKMALGWPESFFTWDVLFLIPLPWISPVLAPIIYSITMILLALIIIKLGDKGKKASLNNLQWTLFIIGSLIILYTFLYDYASIIINNNFLSDFFNLAKNQRFLDLVYSYIPTAYNWFLFWIGELLIIISITLFFWRKK